MKQCPRCSALLNKNDKYCPKCRLEVKKMKDYLASQGIKNVDAESFDDQEEKGKNQNKLSKEEKLKEKQQKKAEKRQDKIERKKRESVSDTDFSQYATNLNQGNEDYSNLSYREKNKRRKEKSLNPQFEIDENGEFNINTDDVELVGKETGKIIDEKYRQSYSIKKSRGDYIPPRIKWWELYKIADRSFARRKIKKEVNKATVKKPGFIKKSKLLLLAIFFGWSGAHNFYAKNKKKGWVSVISLIIEVVVAFLANYSSFFASIVVSISGCAGFVNLFIWISDVVSIIFNKFKYRIQREAFIFSMNVETRAKLGEKYIDQELYHKPWHVRFKVWWERKKRNFEEDKREKRQAKIDRQKRRLQKEEELERQDEEKINQKIKEKERKSKVNESVILDDQTMRDINSFDGGLTQTKSDDESTKEDKGESENEEKHYTSNKSKAKKSFKSKKK